VGLFGKNKGQASIAAEMRAAGQVAIERGDADSAFEIFSQLASAATQRGNAD
jgi:hypothetical protein